MEEVLIAIRECIVRFFDRLFQPKVNREFELLRSLVESDRVERDRILASVMELVNPPAEIESEPVNSNFQPLNAYTPWRVRQQQLEKERRDQFNSMNPKSTKDLEEELGVSEGV